MNSEPASRGTMSAVSERKSYSDWKRWSEEAFARPGSDEGRYFTLELSASGVGPLQGRRVLEIGFGNGAFAGWALEAGADYRGVEADPELLARARGSGLRVMAAGQPLTEFAEEATVDLIVGFDVFEHVDRAVLPCLFREMRTLLKPGGLLIGRVPSGDSPFGRVFQNGDLTHLTALGSEAVRQLAAMAGLEVVAVRGPVSPAAGGVRARFRRAVKQGVRRLVYPVVARLLMDWPGAVLTPNMVFVLRRSRTVAPPS